MQAAKYFSLKHRSVKN